MEDVAIVTGGTSGIGLAIGKRLLSEGFEVIRIGRRPEELCPPLRDDGWALSRYFRADLSAPEETERLISKLRPFRPRVLVHAAGQHAEVTPKDPLAARRRLMRLCELHAGAALQLAFGLAPVMAARGHIILISSTATRRAAPGQAAYAASKGALDVLTRHLASALGPDIRVNALAPGLVRTPMSEPVFSDDELLRHIEAKTPLGRVACGDDIAAAALQLILAEPSWITGEVLTVDGGNHIPW